MEDEDVVLCQVFSVLAQIVTAPRRLVTGGSTVSAEVEAVQVVISAAALV